MSDNQLSSIARALGSIPSGCAILTATAEDRSTGMLTSWVQQAGFEPPVVTVAIKKGRPIQDIVEMSRRFAINLLAESQTQTMFRHFGRGFGPEDDAFEGIDASPNDYGVTIDGALAELHCVLIEAVDAGDHMVYLGKVAGASFTDSGKPYVHLRRNGLSY